MGYFFVFIVVVCTTAQSVAGKEFGKHANGKAPLFYIGIGALASCLSFYIFNGLKFTLVIELMPYALAFALFYAMAICSLYFAVNCGPLSLTNLVTAYSLMMPTLYGLIFLKEKITVFLIIGVALLCASLFFVNYKKEKGVKITLRWVIFCAICFVGNGMAAIAQKIQQTAFDGGYKNEFMMLAVGIVAIAILIYSAIKERNEIKEASKFLSIGMANGLANAAANYLVMVTSAILPVSIMFPLISGGGIILAAALSIFLYKEKLSKMQIIGILLGTASVVLLSI